MMVLATGTVTARQDPERFVVTFESGSNTIEIAMTLHQACHLSMIVMREAAETIDASRQAVELIRFPRRRGRRRR